MSKAPVHRKGKPDERHKLKSERTAKKLAEVGEFLKRKGKGK